MIRFNKQNMNIELKNGENDSINHGRIAYVHNRQLYDFA